ncbi:MULTISPECIES: type II secretion system protein GspL [Paraburkholderia]|uniref:Type II secretion system protein GspL n=1 Tax=Paraburkholderia podalyriae TaxID=1938811 RepID=A0ABR7PX10_9BURK|nr:type II secretion system protein GspL [Paraburkholderia podalyriae]MBC8750754.1 type II secretion system protein GspL [Paraburkholderia podalyriae]
MSSLIVLLPSSDMGVANGGAMMPFALFDREGKALRAGLAAMDALPRAHVTVLILVARDALLLNVTLPPVTGARLRRILPNVVEEFLIQDAQRSHIAIDPTPQDSGVRCAAVVDREWFASVIERFTGAGHRRLRAVPLIHCIPLLTAALSPPSMESPAQLQDVTATERPAASEEPEGGGAEVGRDVASALIMRRDRVLPESAESQESPESHDDTQWVELALRQGALGFGASVPAVQLDATIAELAKRQALMVYSLAVGADDGGPPVNPDAESGKHRGDEKVTRASEPAHLGTDFPLATHVLPWVSVAREALACRFDLCQFEFANAGRSRPGAGGLKPWRVALGFVAASLVVSIVAVNVQWFELRHRRDALNAQMTQLVKTAFPGTTVILDPHAQMGAELARLRRAAGELRSDDFLAIATGVAHALGPVPSSAIAGLDYNGGALDMTFKPGTTIDSDGLKRRLTAQGLSAQEDNGKWTVKSVQSGPR